MIKEILVSGDAADDQVGVCPRDRLRHPVLHLRVRLEAEPSTSRSSRSASLPRLDVGRAVFPVNLDEIGEVQNARFGPRGEVVDLACRAAHRRQAETLDQIFDEIPRGDAAAIRWDRKVRKGTPGQPGRLVPREPLAFVFAGFPNSFASVASSAIAIQGSSLVAVASILASSVARGIEGTYSTAKTTRTGAM